MPSRLLLSALVLMIPGTSLATETAARCMALGREIGGATQMIGSTEGVNGYASALARQNSEIRQLRIEMSRVGCGKGSIVTLGSGDGAAGVSECGEYSGMLASMENNRDAIVTQRHASLKVVRSLGRDEATVREEMRQLRCGEIDYAAVPASIGVGDMPAAQNAVPDPSSSIIHFDQKAQATVADASPPMPERDWDPSKPIRTVGPQFFPDNNEIDLASPKQPSRQPLE